MDGLILLPKLTFFRNANRIFAVNALSPDISSLILQDVTCQNYDVENLFLFICEILPLGSTRNKDCREIEIFLTCCNINDDLYFRWSKKTPCRITERLLYFHFV